MRDLQEAHQDYEARKKAREEACCLRTAVRDGAWDVVASLLDRGVDPDGLGPPTAWDGAWATLHHAAHCNAVPMIRLLLAHGATLDVQDRSGRTPLARAATPHRGPSLDAMALLLQRGATVEVRSEEGTTILHEMLDRFFEEQRDEARLYARFREISPCRR